MYYYSAILFSEQCVKEDAGLDHIFLLLLLHHLIFHHNQTRFKFLIKPQNLIQLLKTKLSFYVTSLRLWYMLIHYFQDVFDLVIITCEKWYTELYDQFDYISYKWAKTILDYIKVFLHIANKQSNFMQIHHHKDYYKSSWICIKD